MDMKKALSKIHYTFMALMLFSITGCQSNSKKPDQDTTKFTSNTKAVKAVPILRCDTTITSIELSDSLFAFQVFKSDANKIKTLFLDPVVLKMSKATNDGNEQYDLYNFTDGTNRITLYANDGGFYVQDSDIKNARVLLNKKISIGMTKDSFLGLLKVKGMPCDTILVTNEESTFESAYIFKNARLQEITAGQILE